MINYLKPEMKLQPGEIPAQGLAYIGDAVFELMVCTWLCITGTSTAKNLHNKAVSFVCAKAQAEAAEKIKDTLTEEEESIFKRGRNAHQGVVPKNSTHKEYHSATGIETLFGYLYLTGETDRLNELFTIITQEK